MGRHVAIAAVTLLAACSAPAEKYHVVDTKTMGFDGGGVQIKTLFETDFVTVNLVHLNGKIKRHYHSKSAETVVVLDGTGKFYIADDRSFKETAIGPGSVLYIPVGAHHEVESSTPISAVSIFSPRFNSNDRIFVEK